MIKENNKKYILGILLIGAFLFVTGVSYALWSMILQQTDANIVNTACFKIEFTDENPINLERTYPIRDEEARKLIPYTFAITNTCDSYATYQINLEILNTTTLNHFKYIATSLNEKSPSVLTNFEEVQPTLNEAIRSYKLETGYLDKNETKTFTLRIWLDESTPASEDFMNKVLESKVTIITSFLPKSPSFSEVITNCS